ncbi:MAG: hypothetical protein NC097_04920 [Clostridium sp.]|nr:hypothetical protein [Prevotella sp.]MCM1429119.1 hypothetical protein [Clostridium sp.]MCM1475353.1 hypothetical protein [Muribaculaceae bacterium]
MISKVAHMLKNWSATAMILLLVILSGCREDGLEVPVAGDGSVELAIRVRVNSPSSGIGEAQRPSATRAADYSFQLPTDPYESAVESLRVIIVRTDEGNKVEHNQLFSLVNYNNNVDNLGYLRFPVTPDENKRVFFVANENSLPENIVQTLTAINAGELLPEGFFDITWKSEGGNPIVDNTGSSKKYIPMTEYFDLFIDTKESQNNGVTTIIRDFFITRAVTKFRFSVEPTTKDETNGKTPGYEIESITFLYNATEEYLFPHDAVYSPEKYARSTEPDGGRAITSFSIPSTAMLHGYTFNPSSFGIAGKILKPSQRAYSPLLYFPECRMTEDKVFYISAVVRFDSADGNDSRITFSPVKLPNLPNLPRNTIVDVRIRVNPVELTLSTALVPYYVTVLKPEFGNGNVIYHPDDYNDLTEEEKAYIEINQPGVVH